MLLKSSINLLFVPVSDDPIALPSEKYQSFESDSGDGTANYFSVSSILYYKFIFL